MTITPDDKRIIAEYMGWEVFCNLPYAKYRWCGLDILRCLECEESTHRFDLNDAGECVGVISSNGHWRVFQAHVRFSVRNVPMDYLTAWLFHTDEENHADNFFAAMVEWLKGRK